MKFSLKKDQLLIGVLVILLIVVMAWPIQKEESNGELITAEVNDNPATEEQLERILQKIAGVGCVEVLITYEDYGKQIVEKDTSVSEELMEEADSTGGKRTTTTTQHEVQTVYEDADSPYVVQEMSPTVSGILVVAEGGGNESVKKQIQETIEALFGLEAHRISIMKMEVSK